MITYKMMSQLALEELTAIWNEGFEGYFINLTMDIHKFLTRMVNDGLSLEHSFVMYEDGKAIGFVMNGFRFIDGKKVGWNGGTGIATEFRGKGFGKELMKRNLELYREQGVEIALLEAFVQNERAIKLYQQAGYETTEQLIGLQSTEGLNEEVLMSDEPNQYSISFGMPVELSKLPLYKGLAAWQTQWPNVKDGQSVIVSDGNELVGYALFKQVFHEEGHVSAVVLYQCEAAADRIDTEQILLAALRKVFHPADTRIRRTAMHIRHTNEQLLVLLRKLGFAVYAELVHMKRIM